MTNDNDNDADVVDRKELTLGVLTVLSVLSGIIAFVGTIQA